MALTDLLVQGIQFQGQGRRDDAARLFAEVLAMDPGNGPALYSLSVMALHGGNIAEALHASERGVLAAPGFAPLRYVLGAVLQALGRIDDALLSFDAALAIDPKYVDVLLNSGVLLRSLFRHREALERFNTILTIDPGHTGALANAAILLTEFKQSEQAIAMFQRLLELQPDYDYAPGLLFFERLHICDWTGYEQLRQRIGEGVRAGKRSCKSLAFMSASDSASDHLQAASTFASHFAPRRSASLWNGERYHHERIRLAYISPDFREHPVAHLMAGVIERHDRSRFETIAISLGIDDQSRLRHRMAGAFGKFIDARGIGTAQVAQLMRDMEVDIAVDLGGYTSDTRTDILAHRPAPVQVNYLGYPGTMGSDYYDYILADRHVIPPEHQRFYTEKVMYLPDAYLPTDASVRIADRTPSRAECGLPETGLVFCSFSHDYKLCPPVFAIWMRLLAQVPGSVLWLMSRGDIAQRNLRSTAASAGIDPARLVFAGRVPLVEDHMARYRQADVFLDTHPYNAHTTAADALMAGLPVVTCMGHSFPSRVAGSLLHAAGVPELATQSLADYEALALLLARDTTLRGSFRARLNAGRSSAPLFDTAAFSRNLEACYVSMWRAQQLGEFPDALGNFSPKSPAAMEKQ